MKSIGILYICTGPYYLFWEDFFKSFEAKFLTDYEKKYEASALSVGRNHLSS